MPRIHHCRRLVPLMLTAALAGCDESPAPGHGALAPAPKPVAVAPFRMGEPDVVLLVTGGTHGLLEVCNCSGPMAGGLARRSGLVRSYRAAFDNTFCLDSGDVFWVEPKGIQNRYVLKAYRQIGYDAVVLGDQEWAMDQATLTQRLTAVPAVYLSTTVAPVGGKGKLPVVEVIERRWGDLKLAVVSDVEPDAFMFVRPERVKQLAFRPPEELARRVRGLKDAGFLVVLVCHGGAEYVLARARGVDADLIVRGHTSRPEKKLLRAAGKPVVKVGGTGTLGAVALKVRDGKIADIELRCELVDTRWPMDQRLLHTYQAYAHVAMRAALDAERRKGLEFVPSATCGKCHRQQHAKWQQGPHARAYKTLVRVKRTGDPNCLTCHTTGFGTEEGFYTIEKTPQLAGVNCQDCHRIGHAEHIKRPAAGKRPVDEDVCTSCHTPVTAPKFTNTYKSELAKVRCPRGRPDRKMRPAGALNQ